MWVITHSQLATARTCLRKFWFAYVLGKRALRVPQALQFGTVAHECLKAYWLARKHRPAAKETWNLDAFEALARSELEPFAKAKLHAMLALYMACWDPICCTVLEVEKSFSFRMINPLTEDPLQDHILAGKIDAIIRLADGRIAPVEHKTTADEAQPGGRYRQRLTMDGQISQYFEGCEALGLKPDVLLYDILRKPRHRPLLETPLEKRFTKKGVLRANARACAETPQQYHARVTEEVSKSPDAYILRLEVTRTDRDLYEYAIDVWQYLQVLGAFRSAAPVVMPPRNVDSCWRYDEPCEFWDVCTHRASIHDSTRFRTLNDPNEELLETL